MKRTFLGIICLLTILYITLPVKVSALSFFDTRNEQLFENKLVTDTNGMMNGYDQPQNCNTLLGNPSDSNSVAWLIDKILSYATIAGMALVVVLSSIDFAKVIVKSDDDEMAKATKKLVIRLVLAGLLFFVPTLTKTLLGLFGLTSDVTCGIQQW